MGKEEMKMGSRKRNVVRRGKMNGEKDGKRK